MSRRALADGGVGGVGGEGESRRSIMGRKSRLGEAGIGPCTSPQQPPVVAAVTTICTWKVKEM